MATLKKNCFNTKALLKGVLLFKSRAVDGR